MIPNPQPLGLVLVLPAVAGILRLGDLLAGRAVPGQPRLQRWLAPGIGLAAWLVVMHLLARWLQGFPAVMVAATVGLGLAGLLGRRPAHGDPPRPGVEERRPSMVATGLAASAAIGWIAHRSHFFDHFNLPGHWQWVAALQNGVFPLRQPHFPERLLAYHDGFDVAAAALTAMTRVPVPVAIDIVTTALFFYAWCLAWLLGEALFGGRSGLWCSLGTFLGGGLGIGLTAYKLLTRPALAAGDLVVNFGDLGAGLPFNPPVLAYLFQPPFIAGLPLALAAMLLIVRQERMRGWALLALTILLAGLYTAQVIFFLTVAGAASFVYLALERNRGYAVALPLLLLAVVLCGGMLFTPGGGTAPGSFRLRVWLLEWPAVAVLGWQTLYFGALLPLGLVGAVASRRRRVLLLLLTLGCVAAPNLVAYAFTWDMVKFFAVGSVFLGLLAGGFLAGLWARQAVAPRLAALALLAVLLATPVTFLAATAWAIAAPAPALANFTAEAPPAASADERRVIDWLRRHAGPTEVVHPPANRALAYAVLGGLPVSWPNIPDHAFPASASQVDARRSLLAAGEPTAAELLAQGIRWLVIDDPGSSSARAVVGCRAAGTCRPAYGSGGLEVFDLAGREEAGR